MKINSPIQFTLPSIFEDISEGGIFRHNDRIYMKIIPSASNPLIFNAVHLNTGLLYYFDNEISVSYLSKANLNLY